MRKIAFWETRHPRLVLIIALLLLIPAAIGFLCTKVNYDLFTYLPDELESVQGEQILDETFHNAGMSIVITDGMMPRETKKLKEKIGEVPGVSQTLWVDNFADVTIPQEIFPDLIQSVFFSGDGEKTMLLVQYETAGSSDETLDAIEEIKGLLNRQSYLSGLTVIVEDIREITEHEAFLYIAVASSLALLIMAILMESWLLPLVLLFALGIAVLYNMGTNFMMGSISFITQCVAATLQLGVTMDYSIFLIDRYEEEKPHFDTREEAMAEAVAKSFTALTGSSLTTFFGFVALCFMKLGLGFDIGFVMAKGVLFGVLTVLFILPVILLLMEDKIKKYQHRNLKPSFHGLNNFVMRHRRGFVVLFFLLLIPTYILQSRMPVYYNMDRALPANLNSLQGLEILKKDFHMACTHFVIVDDTLPSGEILAMEEKIGALDGISSVLSYNSVVGTAIPESILPDGLLEICKKDGRQLMMVNSDYAAGTPEMTDQLEKLDQVIKKTDPNGIITGEGAITQGLIDTTAVDFKVTGALSIIAIFILVAICFKSLTIPIILVLSIKLAIWINLSLSTIFGSVQSFVDSTCVNCIQLGATVDYAILLTTRFQEERRTLPVSEAIRKAANAAEQSIFQSAAVFFMATFGVYLVSNINIVCGMCALLARGAIISELAIMFFLSPLLCTLEPLIAKTTKNWVAPANQPRGTDLYMEEVN